MGLIINSFICECMFTWVHMCVEVHVCVNMCRPVSFLVVGAIYLYYYFLSFIFFF